MLGPVKVFVAATVAAGEVLAVAVIVRESVAEAREDE